jgi:hypothetical protein
MIKDIKIILKGGEGHDTAHRKAGDIDKKTEIAEIRDKGWVAHGLV